MAIEKFTLDNGVRVLVEKVTHVGSVSIGLWCRTGSVNEQANEAGITHLIEHMLFKGTGRRTARQIAEDIEGRGGMLNAFTDKEQTCYYSRLLADDAEVAIDVLCDMMTGSLIDPEELAREQGVVLEEIKRSEDEPGDHVHDLHIEGLWPSHKFGLPVIGTRESVSSFGRDDLTAYIDRRYQAGNVILAATGNVEPQAILAAATERLSQLQPGNGKEAFDRPLPTPGSNLVPKDVEQVHFCIGGEGRSHYDSDYYTLAVTDGVLGSGMSSRLFQEVREKRGLVYAIGSYALTYSAGGAFTIYGGTGLGTWGQVQEIIATELNKLIRDGVTEDELARVKKNLSGTLVLALEGMSSRMMRMARNEFVHGREVPIEETLAKLEAVTPADVQALAEQILPAESLRTTAIGPF